MAPAPAFSFLSISSLPLSLLCNVLWGQLWPQSRRVYTEVAILHAAVNGGWIIWQQYFPLASSCSVQIWPLCKIASVEWFGSALTAPDTANNRGSRLLISRFPKRELEATVRWVGNNWATTVCYGNVFDLGGFDFAFDVNIPSTISPPYPPPSHSLALNLLTFLSYRHEDKTGTRRLKTWVDSNHRQTIFEVV